MPATIGGVPHAEPNDSVSSWQGTSRALAAWIDENTVRRGDIINDAPPADPHTHAIAEVQNLSTRLGALQAALDALTPGPWVGRPLTSPWVAYSTDGSYYPGIRARRTAAGVQIQGMVKGGAANTEICTLPAELNPQFGGHFPAISNSAAATVFISGTGQLRYLSGGSGTSYVSVNLVVPLP